MPKTTKTETVANDIAKIETPVVEKQVETPKQEDITKIVASQKTEIDELKRMVEMLLKVQTSTPQVIMPESLSEKDIDVVSLYYGVLNLSTDGKGGGNKYSFTKFGEVKTIPYFHLRDICDKQKRFAREGLFYIMDSEIVKKLHLESDYKNILNKQMIDELFTQKREVVIKLFKGATDSQKETIISIAYNKVKNNENIDMNIVDALSNASGVDINKMVKEEQQIEE